VQTSFPGRQVDIYLFSLLFVLLTSRPLFFLISDQKSILTDNDWKKLWMRGGINGDSKQDNNLDTSDSPMFEDSEVSLNDRWSLFFWPIECNKLLSNTNLN